MAIELRVSNGIVEFFSATSTTTPSGVNISDAAIGDVRVIVINSSPDGTGTVPTAFTITGWTAIFTSTVTGAASDSRLSGFYREVQSGDTLTGDSLSWTYSNTATTGSVSFTLEGVDLTNILDQTSPTPSTGSHPIVSPSITTQTDDAWVISAGIQDGTTGAIDDTDVPTGMTVLGTMNNNPPSNGMNLGAAYVEQASLGASGTKTWQTNTGSEERVGASFAFRPAPEGITAVLPSFVWMDVRNVNVYSESDVFDASSNTVYLSDDSTLAGGTTEVDISNAIRDEAIGLITLDLTLLSDAELADLQTLGPGDKFLIVDPVSGEVSFPVTLARPHAFIMSRSIHIPDGGVATTARLVAPSGKTTGDFVAGELKDDLGFAQVNITLDNYTEVEYCLAAKDRAEDNGVYQFRIVVGAFEPIDTYTVDPRWTVTPSVEGAIRLPLKPFMHNLVR